MHLNYAYEWVCLVSVKGWIYSEVWHWKFALSCKRWTKWTIYRLIFTAANYWVRKHSVENIFRVSIFQIYRLVAKPTALCKRLAAAGLCDTWEDQSCNSRHARTSGHCGFAFRNMQASFLIFYFTTTCQVILLDINYFHCLRIVDILKETEAESKNIFGRYSSQRMKDWQEIVKLYEKENIYLGRWGYSGNFS